MTVPLDRGKAVNRNNTEKKRVTLQDRYSYVDIAIVISDGVDVLSTLTQTGTPFFPTNFKSIPISLTGLSEL